MNYIELLRQKMEDWKMNNFERGRDPKVSIGLGCREIFKSMEGCLLLTEKDLYQNINNQYYDLETVKTTNIKSRSDFIFNSFIIIIVIENRFRIIKNRFANNLGYDKEIHFIEDLPKIIFQLKALYDDYMTRKSNNYE